MAGPSAHRVSIVLALLTAIVVGPWFVLYVQQSVSFNQIWLIGCAGRLLSGLPQSVACFDQEPPLCILVEALPALMVRLTSISPLVWLPIYNFSLVGLSALACRALFRRDTRLTPVSANMLLAAYVIANTALVSRDLGERDHIAVLGLFPFALLQMAITDGRVLPGRKKTLAILVAGTIAALIKPHYLLLPAVLGLERVWRRRSILAVIRDPDSVALIAGTALYAGVLALFFRDYFTQILPDAVHFYANKPDFPLWPAVALIAILVGFVGLAAWWSDKPAPYLQRWMALVIACVIVYLLQDKGYGYHLDPAEIFLFMATSSVAMGYFKPENLRGAAMPLLYAAIAYVASPLDFAAPRVAAYRDYPLTRIADSVPDAECHFFMLDSMHEVQSVAAYSRCGLATRFPSLWFLRYLLAQQDHADKGLPYDLTPAVLTAKEDKYADLVAADFTRYRPETVLIADAYFFDGQTVPFDFGGFFSAHSAAFRTLWPHYVLRERVTVDRPDFFRGTRFASPVEKKTYSVYVLAGQ